MDQSFISIITISFNAKKHIKQTIQSVIHQNYSNKEYILIDAGSQDGTIEIINKYGKDIDYWISEPDKGIADAMNKGLKAAKGDYILFLHSDDYLINENVLSKASQFLDHDHDIFLFDLYYSDNGNKTKAKPRGLGWWMNFKTGVLHQSCICSKILFEKIGIFDTNYKIAMDYDFFLRAYRTGAKTRYIGIPFSVMRKTGISSRLDWPGLRERFDEERQVHLKNCPNYFMRLIYLIYWSAYIPYRYLLCRTGRS